MSICYGIEVNIAYKLLKPLSTSAILVFDNDDKLRLYSHDKVFDGAFVRFLNHQLFEQNPIISWYSNHGWPELKYVWHLGELKIYHGENTLVGLKYMPIEAALKGFTLGLKLIVLPNSGEFTKQKWWKFNMSNQVDWIVAVTRMDTEISVQQRKIISIIGEFKSASPTLISYVGFLDMPTLCGQLSVLKKKGYVWNTSRGRNSFYQISDSALATYFNSVHYVETIKRNPESDWRF
jgi:hypothetical protein